MSNTVVINGAKELYKTLNSLPIKLERKIMRQALRSGASVIAQEAKLNVPKDSGDLKKSIRTSSNSKKGLVEANAVVGSKKAYYAMFVEFGTAAHMIKPKKKKKLSFTFADGTKFLGYSVNHLGAVAKPFMRPAYDNKHEEAIKQVADRIRERLAAEGIK